MQCDGGFSLSELSFNYVHAGTSNLNSADGLSSPFAVKIGELKLALLRNAILGAIENVFEKRP